MTESLHPAAAFGFGGDRPQEIRTPPEIIAMVLDAFEGPIALDPCAPTFSDPSFPADRYVREAENGLTVDWGDRTFVNPPFDDLRPWLRKAANTGAQGHRVILLTPWRSHRRWFREALQSTQVATFLDATKFVGYKTTFPVPLALLCWNCVAGPGLIGAFTRID